MCHGFGEGDDGGGACVVVVGASEHMNATFGDAGSRRFRAATKNGGVRRLAKDVAGGVVQTQNQEGVHCSLHT